MRRRLSQVERLLWALDDQCRDNGVVIAEVTGPCSEPALRAAVAAVRRRHPLLAVRIDRPGLMTAWLTTDAVPEIPVRVAEAAAWPGWQSLAEAELQRPFDLRSGPLVRFVLAASATGTTLMLVFHHLIADGTSVTLALRDVLRHLADPTTDLPPVDAIPAEDFVPAGARRRRRRLPIRTRRDRPRGRPLSVPGTGFALITWSLDRADSDALLRRCRREGTSVHAALCTAFLWAGAQRPGRTWLQSPVDARRLLSVPPEMFGLFITLVETPVEAGGPADFWATARALKADLTGGVVPADTYAQVCLPRPLRFMPVPLLRRLGRFIRVRFDLSVTNLGRLPMPARYGPLRVRSIYLAVSGISLNHRVLGVTSLDGRMFFSLASFDRAGLEGVRERATALLADAVTDAAHQPG